MRLQTSTGNSSGLTALPFFILPSAFPTSPLPTQSISSSTTSASPVPGSLPFSSFISLSKHSFHLLSVSEHTITLPFLSFINLTCCTSFSAPPLYPANLHNSLSPSSTFNPAYKLSYEVRLRHCNRILCLTPPPFLVDLFNIFISYLVPCFLRLFLLFHALLNLLISLPCLPVSFPPPKCHS